MHILFGCCNSALTLFLKAMQNKDSVFKFHRVNGAIRAAGIVLDDFKHTGPAKTSEWLRCVMLFTPLRKIQSVTKELSHADGKGHQILFGAANPFERFFFAHYVLIIHEKVYCTGNTSHACCDFMPGRSR